MKILLIVLFAVSFVNCKEKNLNFRPDTPAKYSVTIEVQPAENTPTVEEVEAVFQLLTENAESNGIVYQSVQKDPDNKRITFDVAGLLSENGIDYPRLDFIAYTLTGGSSLEFWDVYQNTDDHIGEILFKLNEDFHINNWLSPNFPIPDYSTAIIGTAAPEDIARLDSIFKLPEVLKLLPTDMALAWSFYSVNLPEEEPYFELFALKKSPPTGPFLAGNEIQTVSRSAENTEEKGAKTISIDLEFTYEGARVWAGKSRWAAENSNRAIAIMIDDWVLLAPKITGEITNGRCTITGNFDWEESLRLMNKIKLGILPYELKVVDAKEL